MIDEVRSHLKQMLDLGVVQLSQSPFSSGVVLVRKKDGGLRFCIDLRRLNASTVEDAYALPRIDESLVSLSGSAFSTFTAPNDKSALQKKIATKQLFLSAVWGFMSVSGCHLAILTPQPHFNV